MRHVDEETWSIETATERDCEIQALRCAEDGHHWENCCTIILTIYQRCRWCGAKRSFVDQLETGASS